MRLSQFEAHSSGILVEIDQSFGAWILASLGNNVLSLSLWPILATVANVRSSVNIGGADVGRHLLSKCCLVVRLSCLTGTEPCSKNTLVSNM